MTASARWTRPTGIGKIRGDHDGPSGHRVAAHHDPGGVAAVAGWLTILLASAKWSAAERRHHAIPQLIDRRVVDHQAVDQPQREPRLGLVSGHRLHTGAVDHPDLSAF